MPNKATYAASLAAKQTKDRKQASILQDFRDHGYVVEYLRAPSAAPTKNKDDAVAPAKRQKDASVKNKEYSEKVALSNVYEILEHVLCVLPTKKYSFNKKEWAGIALVDPNGQEEAKREKAGEVVSQNISNSKMPPTDVPVHPEDPNARLNDGSAFHLPGMWTVRSDENLYNHASQVLGGEKLWVDIDRCSYFPQQKKGACFRLHEDPFASTGSKRVCGFMAYTKCTFQCLGKPDDWALIKRDMKAGMFERRNGCWLLKKSETRHHKSLKDNAGIRNIEPGQFILWNPALPYRLYSTDKNTLMMGMPCGFRVIDDEARSGAYSDGCLQQLKEIAQLNTPHPSNIQAAAIIQRADSIVKMSDDDKRKFISEKADRVLSFVRNTAPILTSDMIPTQAGRVGTVKGLHKNTIAYIACASSRGSEPTTNERAEITMNIAEKGHVFVDVNWDQATAAYAPYLLMPPGDVTDVKERVAGSPILKVDGTTKRIGFKSSAQGIRAAKLLGWMRYDEKQKQADTEASESGSENEILD